MRKEAENFWKQAQADFKTAKDNIESENYYATAFFCQQTIREIIESIIHYKNTRYTS